MNSLMLQSFTYRLQVIEVALKSGGTKTKFDDQPQLNNAIIFKMRALNATDMPLSPLTGLATITAVDMAKASLQLYEGSEVKLDTIPLILFHDTQNATPTTFVRDQFKFNQLCISWTKSFVLAQNETWAQDEVMVLIVEYAYPEDFGFLTVDEYFASLQSRKPIPVVQRK